MRATSQKLAVQPNRRRPAKMVLRDQFAPCRIHSFRGPEQKSTIASIGSAPFACLRCTKLSFAVVNDVSYSAKTSCPIA